MFKCKICNKEFEKEISLHNHIGTSYGWEIKRTGKNVHLPLFVYYAKYDGLREFSKENLEKMYITDKISTPKMAEQLKVEKVTLLNTMHFYHIPMRNASEQTKNWIEKDGIWNKGKTKFDHPSIMRYSKSRIGKDNPYFTAPNFDARYKKSCESTKYLINSSPSRNPKSTEMRMVKILDAQKISYKRNFCLKRPDGRWRLYDFIIGNGLLIELHGDYWHANPKFYKSSDIIPIRNLSKKGTPSVASEIWKWDAEKQKLAINFGYKSIVIWEHDFKQMSDVEVVDLIKNAQTSL